jgi:hypothetical protein
MGRVPLLLVLLLGALAGCTDLERAGSPPAWRHPDPGSMPGKGEIDPDDGFMEHLARRGEPAAQAVAATLAVAPPQRPRKAMASST